MSLGEAPEKLRHSAPFGSIRMTSSAYRDVPEWGERSILLTPTRRGENFTCDGTNSPREGHAGCWLVWSASFPVVKMAKPETAIRPSTPRSQVALRLRGALQVALRAPVALRGALRLRGE